MVDPVHDLPVFEAMILALYSITAALLLWLCHRRITPLSRAAAAIVFLIPFVFTGYAVITSRVYAPIDHPWDTVPLNWMKEQYGLTATHNGFLSDVSTQMIPWRAAVRWSLAHGEWPLWNRFILSGDILAPAAQPAPYSPFTLIACLLPVALSMTFTAAIAHFVAALGAFLLARALGCREAAALVAAAGFTYATGVTLFILWPLGFAWAFAPWVFLGVRRQSLSLLTTAFVLLLLAGHPESALHVVTLAAAFALVTVPPRVLPRLALAGMLALLLCAIQWMPIVEMAPQTMEHATRTGVFARTPRGVAAHDALMRLATDAFPILHTRTLDTQAAIPIDSAAAGSIVLALAIYAMLRVRSREAWFLAGMTLFCLLARAEWKPLARALQKLPLFDQTLNERFSFGAALALAMLAALGVEEILRRGGDRVAVVTLIAVLAALSAGNVWLRDPAFVPVWGRYKMAAELAGLAIAIVLVALRAPRFLIAILLLQRFVSDGGIYRTFDARVAYPPIPMLAPLRDAREPFRITGHGNAFIPGTSALYALEDVRGYEAMTFLRYRETYPLWCIHQPVWFNRVDDLTRPFLSFLNVRYAITWDRDPPPPGWREVSRQKGSMLIENMRVLPRAFVPRRIRGGDALDGMAHETDFGERAWIDGITDAPNGPGSVVVRNRKLGYDLDVTMQNDGWVVASLPAWSGWRATIDGRRVETRFANHAFLGVPVPRGRHRVELVFLPRSFVIGAWISNLVATLIVARSLRFRRR
jgi:hypothetical protein